MIKTVLKYLLLVILLGTFGWTIKFLWSKSEKPPVVFETKSPVKTDIIQKTVATGSILPRKEIFMKSQVSGIIEKVYVLAGQNIRQGDVIAKIKIIPNMVNLNSAENRLNQAKISFENAGIEYERNKKLFDQNIIPRAEFQSTELKYNSAKEEQDAAQNNLDLIRDGVTKSSGNATNTLIRSTISGMLLDVPVKEGNSVIESNTFNEGTTIASVADMGEMIFDGKVDESEVGKLKLGMDLILTVGAISSEKFRARLEYISPKGVTENGAIQFQIKAAVSLAKNQFLRAGYSANADILLAQKKDVLALSESVLQFDKELPYVEREDSPGHFSKRSIKTGISDGINIEVLEGLTLTDKVKVPLASPSPGQ
ncbi:MAG TPA: efflux RND transporter periplasmic adaptor subunit [Bacteroidia bacterium]|jgi:HlyD family secretion protein|nr:efflux RND transporter periplasmic adaptor subunit [Bacteroidia bacterium]